MDWSKKIGFLIISVLVLAACSSRKNYGSVYFARGDVFNDAELDFDLTVSHYIDYADSINNDIRSLSHYENDIINSLDTNILLDTLLVDDKVDSDTIFLEAIELVKLDSSSQVVPDSTKDLKVEDFLIVDSLEFEELDTTTISKSDSLQEPLDSLNKVVIDSSKVKSPSPSDSVLSSENEKKASDSKKIIYTDTLGVIQEKGRDNEGSSSPDSENDSKKRVEDNSSKINNIILVNPSRVNSNKDKTLNDSTKNNDESTEKSDFDNKDQTQEIQNTEKALDSKKTVSVVPIITKENKEAKTDTVTIIKENPAYMSEIDSLKTVNDKLRIKAKSNNSNADTLVYSVFFDSGQQNLSVSNKEVLNTLIQDAKDQNYALQLTGHTDKSGSADFNKTLSENRVKSVFNYIVANGLNEKNIFYQAFGEKYASDQSDLNQRIVSCRLIVYN